ncbi:HvfB family MNIO-type RiPP peptide maturase [Cysteiniphilum litorale]|uniref:HvfB family MNIO-type RiPP peptide maturase n=1 Tax=Cysteiniphilum litorale TaxID=2056700 RepID=UPI003F8813A9
MLDHQAIGLGLRQEFFDALLQNPQGVDFIEIAPENWIGIGGRRAHLLKKYREQFPIILHGLSLSIGGVSPLNIDFIKRIKAFMREHQITIYSEHLSYCSDQQGYLYDLLPLPFSEEMVKHVTTRIEQVQDILECPLILENASYYAAPGQILSEIDFIQAVVSESGCQLLLDVNNVYVNSVNHGYDPQQFIKQISSDKIDYIHVAGHWQKSPELIIDTHGEDVIDPVWQLLCYCYQTHGFFPTLLERDFNLPPLASLKLELQTIAQIQQQVYSKELV